MKKFLLTLVACATALAASAFTNKPYWFTVNVETAVQPTGAGKVYCSFVSADDAKANESTSATKHFNGKIANDNWSEASQTVALYAEGEGNYVFDHYEVNGQKITVTDTGYGDAYKITMTQDNNCGDGELTEDECIAQHKEGLADIVTHIVGVFKEVEKCWFYTSAQVEQTQGGTVSVSFDSEEAAAAQVNSTASAHFNKGIDPNDYSAVTKNLYIHVNVDNGYQLAELTVNGAPMQVNDNGDVIYFARMSAANKCGDGNLSEEECLAQHSANLPAPAVVAAKFEKVAEAPVVNFEVDETNYNEELGAYVGSVNVTVTVENLPEGATAEYSVENREDSEASAMLKEDAEWLPLPASGVVTLDHSALLTVVVKDANGEELASSEIEVKVVADPSTGIEDLKVNGTKVTKIVENGQVIIVKGETRFNTMGQSIK